MPHFDVIVIGAGGVGSAALYHLARRGARVLGMDRFAPPHDRGSSHGQTRIIRQAYFEHADYVPLLLRTYELWKELAEQVGRQLYWQTGLLQVGPPDGIVVPGVCRAAELHNLPVERLTAREVETRWTGLRVDAELVGVFEQIAGYLRVEECVAAHLEAARAAGAELRTGVTVRGWNARDTGVEIITDDGAFSADRLVITAGAWASDLLSDLGIALEVRRKPVFWFACDDPRYGTESQFPAYLFELPTGIFYGFPRGDDSTAKVAEHSGGDPVVDPLAVDRSLHPIDQERVTDFLVDHLPGVTRDLVAHNVCLYTMSPDGDFIVDRHPEHPAITFAAGLSGHGFKFAAVLGEVLADLTLQGQTKLPTNFLGLGRPGLRDTSAES